LAPVEARCAAIYCRISKDDEGDELGVRRQEKLCRELAGRLGWDVAAIYVDDDISAFKKGKRRPGFERLCADITAGRVDSVLVYNPDRLCRDDLRGLEDLIDLLNTNGTEVATVRSGEFDLSTAHGRAQARMAGVWARLESEKMSERLQDKHDELAVAGKPNGGRRPLGYENDRVTVRESEAWMVVEIVERVAAGETLTRIAESLNARGARTSGGVEWTIWTVRRVCLNPRYVGRRIHRGTDVGPADWPALVDETTWRRAVALLKAPERRKRRSARRYLLTGGIVRCGRCGGVLHSKPHRGRNGLPAALYACRPKRQGGCGGVSIRADALEELAAEHVIDLVESTAFARALRARKGGDRKAATVVAKLTAELEELQQAKESGAITLGEYVRFRDGTTARLVEAQAAMARDTTLAAAGRFAGQKGALRAWWSDGSTTLDARQAVVRSVLARIVVAPVGKGAGNRFDASRVTFERVG
jgi:DNA invertase Pin-like site-specific DNA recombinase